jgi:hypothetical protein
MTSASVRSGYVAAKTGRHAPAFEDSADHRPLRTGGLHHRVQILHALLDRRQLIHGDAVRQTRASLVEEDHSGKGREAAKETREARLGPEVFQM